MHKKTIRTDLEMPEMPLLALDQKDGHRSTAYEPSSIFTASSLKMFCFKDRSSGNLKRISLRSKHFTIDTYVDFLAQDHKPSKFSTVDHLVINDQTIYIFDDFKYLGLNAGSTEQNVQVRIGLAWAAFAKLKSILR